GARGHGSRPAGEGPQPGRDLRELPRHGRARAARLAGAGRHAEGGADDPDAAVSRGRQALDDHGPDREGLHARAGRAHRRTLRRAEALNGGQPWTTLVDRSFVPRAPVSRSGRSAPARRPVAWARRPVPRSWSSVAATAAPRPPSTSACGAT